LGKILRKTKLDELPQLINVIKGDMSLVGPRPEVKKWTDVYPEKWAIVHRVKPGITDNASIEFRNEEEILSQSSNPEETYRNIILPHKLELYINYVHHHSFFGDLMIIIRTIQTIIIK
jgi:lipopolysaccharide/colanic/teichoic acid biosynthesis glycosyltransferase